MVIRTRHTFSGMPYGAFGAKSYTTPQVECDVSLFDGKPTGWQDYCNCMFPASDPNRAKCRKRPCANPFDSDPDCVFGVVNPALSFAPWTEAGAGIRGIPKEGGGLLYLFGASLAPVQPEELEPDNFLQIADRDPLRGAWIIAESMKVLASPAGRAYPYVGGQPMMQLHYIQAGSLFGMVPIAGGVMTLANAGQLFLPLGPLNAWMINGARGYALVKDPSGALFEAKVAPIIALRQGEVFNIVGGVAGVFGGNPVPLIAYLCRRAARMLPKTGAADVEIARAMLNAAAESAKTLKEIFDDPQTAFTKQGFYAGIGGTLKNIATVAANAGDAQLGGILTLIGDTMERLDMSLTITAKAIATGNPNLICCDAETAFDYLPERYLGFRFSTLVEIADNLVKAGKATSSDLQKAALGTDKAKSALQLMQDGFNAIVLFAKELDKALKTFGAAGKYFSQVVEDLIKQKGRLDEIASAARAANPAAAIVNTTAGQRVLGKIAAGQRRPVTPGAFPVIPKPVFPAKPPSFTPVTPKVVTVAPPPGVSIGLVLGGAGAGLLIAGPVGAVIGGGAAALLKK